MNFNEAMQMLGNKLQGKYQAYAHELEEDSSALAKLFSEFAEDEAEHAAELLDLLRRYEK